jgi:multidrug efflux pump
MFTHFFIDRPILSAVISILFVLAGAVSMSVSPIEQYPEMAPPSVSISASYPGATAEVIANQVAAPIESQINGIDNLLYFSSTSSSSGNVANGDAARRHGRQAVVEHHDGAVDLFAG